MKKVNVYYKLVKPGIVYGNSLAAIAGFLLASRGHIDFILFVGLLLGLGLAMAAACVLNNILDRDIDKKMKRTKSRPLVTGEISLVSAGVYGTILGLLGFGILAVFTNWLTLGLVGGALFLYVVVYGIAKRKTVYSTLIGTLPGAIPPVAGYVAVTNMFDMGAGLLFMALVLWQMAHFYSIAVYRRDEYAAADLPVISVKSGVRTAKRQIIVYVMLFLLAALLLTYFSYAGIVFALGMLTISAMWLARAVRGLQAEDDVRWAKGMFGFSLKVLLLFCLLLSVDAWLV